tara:strand:+ start:1948 stop:2619 length:672 start_codon:yes stop_codon:yes gene_type:complete
MDIESLLNENPSNTPIYKFVINLLLSYISAALISRTYIRYGRSLSNRKEFSRIFTILSMATNLIITIIKSSLSLSLGLVGALSIVRFRTAIKEPEELSYAFLAIAVGLGFGANQIIITLLGLTIILSLIIFNTKIQSKNYTNLLNLVISSRDKLDIKKIIEIVAKNSSTVNFKRLTETEGNNESSLTISIINFEQLVAIREELLKYNPSIQISFLDESGIINY